MMNRITKVPTGIDGLDEITAGGLPKGRPTLICGGPGSGKTLLAMEFLVNGATKFNEPGVFVAFEERRKDLILNSASIGLDLEPMILDKKIFIDEIWPGSVEVAEVGDYDLEGLFKRIEFAIQSVGAKRVVIDSLEIIFSFLTRKSILRSELARLIRWFKSNDLSLIITAENEGLGGRRDFGVEEYILDCVIYLEQHIEKQIATRRLRISKYRGTQHGTNEYPFLISDDGLSVLPVTSLLLDHEVSSARISSGVEQLDKMLDGMGFFKGSSILVSGTSGTGKTSLAASFASACCKGGQKCLYFSFEESASQIIRNMKSIGIDLQPYIDSNLLMFQNMRPSRHGLEKLLIITRKYGTQFNPEAVVFDPVSNLTLFALEYDVKAMLMRMLDFFKQSQVTTFSTDLTAGDKRVETTEVGISSIMDTWILVGWIETANERKRSIRILKSRGMAHSSQTRELVLSRKGIHLVDFTKESGKRR